MGDGNGFDDMFGGFDDSFGFDDAHDADGDSEVDATATAVDELCHEALVLMEAAEMTIARERAMEAVKLDDEHPFPLFVLGLIAEQEGDVVEARMMSDLALKTAATNADAIQLRAHVHLREGELAEAEQLLRFGVAHNPDDIDLHEGLARVELARGRYEEAAAAAEAVLRLDPGNEGALQVRAAAYDRRGDREGLLAVLRQSSQMFPDDVGLLTELAAAEAEHGDFVRARRLLDRAARFAPHDAGVRDVRELVDGVQDHAFLRPLPRLLTWLREFPGGMVGFVMALLVAALPLRQLVLDNPNAALPVSLLLGAWTLTALYAWTGPALAQQRVNAIAAARANDTLLESLTRPGNEGRIPLDAARIADAVALMLGARHYGQAIELLRTTAPECDEPAKTELTRLAARWSRLRNRAARITLVLPADRRLATATAAILTVSAPALSGPTEMPGAAMYAGALLCCGYAALSLVIERRPLRELDKTLRTIQQLTL